MQVIRPIKSSDFAALKQIAIDSGHGFTSLPVNDELLISKITRSEHSFAQAVQTHGDQGYLFVLEDTHSGKIIGTTAIEATVGMNVPLYHYHRGKMVHHSPTLDVYNTVETLTMCNDYTGSSEICTLFLNEAYRKGSAGRLLSRVRFLFMAEHPERFADTVIAEMRGVSDEEGHSPFWQWLQDHFFTIDFPTADHLIGIGNKVFISELMPKHPIYANLLGEEAQAVIGQVHEKTKPALKLLEKEGFEHRGYVDLFDAGPTVEAKLKSIKTVQQSLSWPCKITEVQGNQQVAVCNQEIEGFRALVSDQIHIDELQNLLLISPAVADALHVTDGDCVRFIQF
ncbi:arginine N-succinyltransferase [Pseudoalteromonas tunicata]|jgi:arginine N-succinyltransferase|uniref:Arginine N-succinyltransferase n=1 Tax=Pseudoalteromonas tunicata D2 TaxID=87626 RepID=A4C4D4_9GAMM|nr:arginine N-succinyltransferase [Pseudoalteromonas tunicata]ATC97101.1 arginine N-succinyltransferase [Pseudoalteromonas tunicata]AXT33210.1 arginine N-succinyltransferase [Pseudoalteromonas tunicata]EAR30416.1 putative arginine succinyltransferase [Pseudoalteromonas tunicata D2]MDP4982105.1 arginine N-succinyltransferase [Pseudoalteromonas tunicata]MDP5215215.1 arginine N-succinyltransferase [Pseudoalteromonas tunicata]